MTDFFTIQVQYSGSNGYYTYLCPYDYRGQIAIGDVVVVPTNRGWNVAWVRIIDDGIFLPRTPRPVVWKQILGILHDLPDITTLNVNLEQMGFEFNYDYEANATRAVRA